MKSSALQIVLSKILIIKSLQVTNRVAVVLLHEGRMEGNHSDGEG